MKRSVPAVFIACLALLCACAAPPPEVSVPPPSSAAEQSPISEPSRAESESATPQDDGRTKIYVQSDTDATDGGFEELLGLMAQNGDPFYQTAQTPGGLLAPDDVVLIKINCQWDERGGTNTDLLKAVIQAVVSHPDGFRGEVAVCDNGQGQYGSAGVGGSLDWPNSNAKDTSQSALDVVNGFRAEGRRVSAVLWDEFTTVAVQGFENGDMADGFVVQKEIDPETGFQVSYPQFTTEYGTKINFRGGVWNGNGYDGERLKVINLPVLKSHGIFQVTGCVKNYMGVVSDKLTAHASHNSVGKGSMGLELAGSRMPALNILDMIWVGAGKGPGTGYQDAAEIRKIAVSCDPVALDYWASKYVLMPAAREAGNPAAEAMTPDGTEPGTFGSWLRLSAEKLVAAGIPVTMEELDMRIIESGRGAASYETITAEEAKRLLEGGGSPVLLDVRTQPEYDEGHIPGAVLIPDTEIAVRAEAGLPDKAALILVYCRTGRRSKLAAAALAELGYTNVKEFGGITDWPYEIE